ncbi:MAG: CRTAC1 family protein [Verrucomicrobiales bacterium]|nr:CRTAC1 family protein [Verrucomicrobiales bacterium]
MSATLQRFMDCWRPQIPVALCLALMTCGCGPSASVPSPSATASDPRLHGSTDWFEDITGRSGVQFVHATGTNYFMPDQIGSGVVLFDCDLDDRLDLFLVQNHPSPPQAKHQLYRQNADGTFRNASTGSGLDLATAGMGAIAGDVNNDGLPDLVLTEYGGTRLFRNQGDGRFEEVTQAAGIDNPRWAAPASFIDFDRDGWLDLVVGNYLDYDPTQVCHDVHGRQDFCAPKVFNSTASRIWRNITGTPGAPPRFEDRTEASGLARVPGAALGLVCADFNGDHWPDIFCADDGRANRLLINRKDGTFVDEAAQRGLALNAMGRTAANMGVVYADFDHDGLGDLFVTHLAEEFHALYRQDQPGLFTDIVAQAGLQQQAWRGTGFGAVHADFDADGHADLAFVNGLVRLAVPGQKPVAAGVDPWWGRYAQRSQLFVNEGGARFRDVSPSQHVLSSEASVGRSLAVGDLNRDGAPDLVIGSIAGPLRLLRNVAPRRGNWIRVRALEPNFGRRDAIGAEIRVKAGGQLRWALVQPATSYLVSHDPALHFGLGSTAEIDSVEVRWPDGSAETFAGRSANQTLVLLHGTGTPVP